MDLNGARYNRWQSFLGLKNDYFATLGNNASHNREDASQGKLSNMDIDSRHDKQTTEYRGSQFPQAMLQTALLLNGAFSGISGFAFMMFARPLNTWMGLDAAVGSIVLIAAGCMLAMYALLLFALAMRPTISSALVKTVVLLDAGWVLGSAALLILNLVGLTIHGKWMVGIMACIVGTFAIAQWIGLRRYAQKPSHNENSQSSSGMFRDIGRSWLGMKTGSS